MKELIYNFFALVKVYLALVIVSFVSAYITTKHIFPAYFISVPLTLYFLTPSAILSHDKAHDELYTTRKSFSMPNVFSSFFIIGTLLLVQIMLPLKFWSFGVDDYNLSRLSPVYVYFSFTILALFIYHDDAGKLTLRSDDFVKDESFFQTIFKILFMQPGILIAICAIIYFVIFEFIPPLIIWLFSLL